MKILAGQLGGRGIEQPATRSTRPLSQKVRGALFDIVGDPRGLAVLDAYAGSGAAGFEALSRGALLVDAIESNVRVGRTIQANARALGVEASHILHQVTLETWLASPRQQPPLPRYGLIIADPPYRQLKPDVLERLVPLMTPGAVLALSHAANLPAPTLAGAAIVRQKVYGDTALTFYAR